MYSFFAPSLTTTPAYSAWMPTATVPGVRFTPAVDLEQQNVRDRIIPHMSTGASLISTSIGVISTTPLNVVPAQIQGWMVPNNSNSNDVPQVVDQDSQEDAVQTQSNPQEIQAAEDKSCVDCHVNETIIWQRNVEGKWQCDNCWTEVVKKKMNISSLLN